MTTETLTCPYCNAAIGVSAGLSAGQRILCPRCGDTFPLRPADAFTGQPTTPAATETAITNKPAATASIAPPPELSLRSRRSPGLVAALAVGVMLLMAGGALIFMLRTQAQRRGYDTSRPPRRPGRQRGVPEPDLPPVVASVAPDKLAALGYLPSDVNFLFAVRVPELLASPAGVRMARDPIKLGNKNYRLEELAAWLGFRLEDIDHLVFAARIDDALLPPFYLVFRTAQPYDEEQMRQRLKATRLASPGKKTLYAFHPPRPDIQLHAWFADERTVVLALFANQLEGLPRQPVDNLQQLSDEVRTVLTRRREPVAPVWIVGHSRDWSKTPAAMFLSGMKKEDQAKLAALRTFGIWLVPEDSLLVKGVFACKDEAGARGLEGYFRSLLGADGNFKTALDGPWLIVQFPTRPDFLSRVLKR
ncbi:MAG TPA: hypothetical protein VMF69_25860 [Gemmataceae bacterium]|nr:hypothetical protein [Gemmataceae bacterium]